MKKSKSFTLLEVLVALMVTAIILPILGGIFYLIMTSPTDTEAMLALTNDISLLTSQLYSDGYMADTFITGGSATCYGNFTWTNTSTNKQYFVVYYYEDGNVMRSQTATNLTTGTVVPSSSRFLAGYITNATDFSLDESSDFRYLVANVTATGKGSMGKTLQKQATIYIEQRPPTYPSGQAISVRVFTNCSYNPNPMLLYGKGWSGDEYFNQSRPLSPSDFLNDSHYSSIQYGPVGKDKICPQNNSGESAWDTNVIKNSDPYGVDTQLYRFGVAVNGSNISGVKMIQLNWVSFSNTKGDTYQLKIYNVSSAAWELFYEKTAIAKPTDFVVTYSWFGGYYGDLSRYVDADGYFNILIVAWGNNSIGLRTNSIELDLR